MGWTPSKAGGLELELVSKVEALYGDATRDMLAKLASGVGLQDGRLEVEDAGALPFVLKARLESLAQKALDDPGLRIPPEEGPGPLPDSARGRLRRSRLYLPGNEPKYMLNAALHRPDAVILDLEDSVAPAAKADALCLVRHALHAIDWGDCERMVRVNQGAAGLADLAALLDAPFHLALLPKIEEADEVLAFDEAAGASTLWFMPILETARGILKAMDVAEASPRTVALTLGLEDLTADLGVVKTPEGAETLFARSFVVHAAKACGLQAIDSVYGDVGDEEGLRASVREAKALGFEGKGCVHPRQIRMVHEELAPDPDAIEKACAIARAFEGAEARGESVVSLGSKMIDPPVVRRALGVVRAAETAGLLAADWREATEEPET
jgi:citrate lyase subunit beta/citryl-CoA lyase